MHNSDSSDFEKNVGLSLLDNNKKMLEKFGNRESNGGNRRSALVRLSPNHHSNKTHPVFACQRGHKRITVSSTKVTWLENSKIPPAQILQLTYSFAQKLSYKQKAAHLSIGVYLISGNMIWDWFSYSREVCILSMENKYATRGKTGKTGRQKFHRGRVVEGNYVMHV